MLRSLLIRGRLFPRDQPASPPAPESRATKSFPGGFLDVTAKVGIFFPHDNGAKGKKLLPETMGSGVAWLDNDGDGILDVYFAGGREGLPHAFYRGKSDGTFELATSGSACDATAVRDGSLRRGLRRRRGRRSLSHGGRRERALSGTRTDGSSTSPERPASPAATWRDRNGVEHPAWSTASLWCDYDLDGDLDLFVAGYVEWTPETDIFTTLDGVTKAFTTPDRYTGLPGAPLPQPGRRHVQDVTEPAGLLPHLGKGLGIAMWDFDGNGYPDIVVANDTRPNFVFMNQGDGTFREEGLAMRVAYDENGRARAGMGIDIADYANDGVPGIAIGNFAGEPMSLYRAAKDGFISAAEQAGLAAATTPALTFGVAFADMDLDGIQDLVVVNGHIEPDIARIQPRADSRAAGAALPRDAGRPVRRRDGLRPDRTSRSRASGAGSRSPTTTAMATSTS